MNNQLDAQKLVSLQQTSILFFSFLSAVILLSLVSFDPQDPGFIHFDSGAIIQNKAGMAGAYFASILIGFFGYLAYLIPLSLLYLGFFLFRPLPRSGGINTWLTILGVFLALLCGCGLVTLLWPESSLTFKAGGLLGLMVAKAFVVVLGDFGSTIALLGGFFAGLTLLLDISWVAVIDKVGEWTLWLFEKAVGPSNEDGAPFQPKKHKSNSVSLLSRIGIGKGGDAVESQESAEESTSKLMKAKGSGKRLMAGVTGVASGATALLLRKKHKDVADDENEEVDTTDYDTEDSIPLATELVAKSSMF